MNLPNKLSIFRMVCTPFMILFFMLPIPNGIGVFIALGIFIIGSLTDLLDGYIARKYNLITDFGKFIDQVADKFIATTAMILVLFYGAVVHAYVAVLALIIVVARDVLIAGVRQIAASKGTVIAADTFGKVKSLFIDVSSCVLMLYLGLAQVISNANLIIVSYVGEGLLIIGTILALISCVNYMVKAKPALAFENAPLKEKEHE